MIAASTVMFLRVLLATVILSRPVALVPWTYLIAPFAVGTLAIVIGIPRVPEKPPAIEAPANPLEFWASLQMAFLFQIVLFGVHIVRDVWGNAGLLVSGAVLGFADLDALTISMAKTASAGVSATTAAQAIAIGVLSNTVLKLVVALALGRADFRRLAGAALATMGLTSALTLFGLR